MYFRIISVGLLFCASPALGSLYLWNPVHRPPVSLRQAIDTARRALQDQGQIQLCASANLFGNKERDGKEGAWNLYFVMADGRVMHVYVDMDAEVEVTTKKWESFSLKPTDPNKPKFSRPDSLEQAAKRLRKVLEDSSIDVFRSRCT